MVVRETARDVLLPIPGVGRVVEYFEGEGPLEVVRGEARARLDRAFMRAESNVDGAVDAVWRVLPEEVEYAYHRLVFGKEVAAQERELRGKGESSVPDMAERPSRLAVAAGDMFEVVANGVDRLGRVRGAARALIAGAMVVPLIPLMKLAGEGSGQKKKTKMAAWVSVLKDRVLEGDEKSQKEGQLSDAEKWDLVKDVDFAQWSSVVDSLVLEGSRSYEDCEEALCWFLLSKVEEAGGEDPAEVCRREIEALVDGGELEEILDPLDLEGEEVDLVEHWKKMRGVPEA